MSSDPYVQSAEQTQCLNRRIPDAASLQSEVAAWEAERTELDVTVNWQFTSEAARTKLHRLYPIIEEAENYRDQHSGSYLHGA